MTARDRTLVLLLAGVAILGSFWFVGLKPKRAEQSTLATQLTAERARLQTAEATVAKGLRAKTDYPRDAATVAELGKAVPADDDLASLMYQLDSVARGARVDFQSMGRSAAAASGSPAPAASGSSSTPPAANGSSSTSAGSSSSSSPSSSSSSTPPSTTGSSSGSSPSAGGAAGATTGSGTPAVTTALPPGSTVGTAGLATLPFTFTFKGSFFELQRLLSGVQGFVRTGDGSIAVRGRLLSVDGVSLVAGTNGMSDLEAKIVATTYLSPSTQDPAASTGSTGGNSTGSTGSASSAPPAPTSSAITTGTS
jgi:hypothetical protein